MAIKQSIELIGDDIVIRKFQNVQKEGAKAINSLAKTTLPELKLPIDPKPMQEFTGHATKLTDILKVLKPALTEAGASVGGLGQFARLAGVGMTGLAAAVGGAVVVRLADLEEQTATTKNKLTDLFGSTANGEKAFNAINTAAGNLHGTVTGLLPAVEALSRGLEKFNQTGRTFKFVAPEGGALPPSLQDPEKQAAAIETFTKILRASGQDFDKAEQTANEFFAALGNGGKLTADMLNKLPTGAITLLAEALGKGKVSAAAFTDSVEKAGGDNIDKVVKALERFKEAANVEFNLKAVLGYKDALNDLKKAAEEVLKDATGKGFSEFLTSELNKAAADLKQFAADLKTAGEFIATTWETIKRPFTSGGGGSATEDQATLVQSFKEAGVQSGVAFKEGIESTLPQTQSAFGALYDWIVAKFSTPIKINWDTSNPFLSGQPTSLAGGGFVRGPGSTTSDSILAFLSNQEFVVNARAVSHYGPALFAALNAMRLPKDFIGRFAMGGLARSVSGNRFAGGGQVKAGNPVILKIDRQTFNMTAGDDTVAALKRFSVAAQLSSTGRKPSWVK